MVPSRAMVDLYDGDFQLTRLYAAMNEPAAPPANKEGRCDLATVDCACTHALAINRSMAVESHSAFTHAMIGSLAASKAGSHRATASLAVMDLPDVGAMDLAAARRSSLTTLSLGSTTVAPYSTEGCTPVR